MMKYLRRIVSNGVYRVTPKPQPVFVRTEISVHRTYSTSLYINATDVYENPTDNITRRLGQISFRDGEELASIVSKLNDLVLLDIVGDRQ